MFGCFDVMVGGMGEHGKAADPHGFMLSYPIPGNNRILATLVPSVQLFWSHQLYPNVRLK